MKYEPPGTSGLFAGLGVFLLVWYVAHKRTLTVSRVRFEPEDRPGSFEARLANYIRLVEYVLGVATGSIVLLVGSAALHENGGLPWAFSSPPVMLGWCVIYGVLFSTLMIYHYEEDLHHHNYNRFRYVRNIGLGFSTLFCFCLGYFWLVCSVAVVMTK